MDNKPIYVTQPSLPPLDEYTQLLQKVWDSGILTHNGPLVQRGVSPQILLDKFYNSYKWYYRYTDGYQST